MATPIQYCIIFFNGSEHEYYKYKLLYREQNWYFHIYFSSIELLSNKLLLLTGSINEKLKYIVVKTRFSLGFNETTIE